MKQTELNQLQVKLDALAVFRGLLADPVLHALYRYLKEPDFGRYSEFVSSFYKTNAVTWGDYIKDICENDENVYVRAVGQGVSVPEWIQKSVSHELHVLQEIAGLSKNELTEVLDQTVFLPDFESGTVNLLACYKQRVDHIGQYGYGRYAKSSMFYVDARGYVVPVKNPEMTTLRDLIDYEREQQILIGNTKALLEGKPAANALLTGDAGTGKSSTVKAIINEFYTEGLRAIEISKDRMKLIPEILDELAGNPLKFILFIDDLSFLKVDDNFSALKAVLEGSVFAKPNNVVIYATSNRRHLVRETFGERDGDDVHRNETMQELVSLSERFGLHVTFQKPNRETFLHIVKSLANVRGIKIPKADIEAKAERLALERGGRSPRLAKQLVDSLLSEGQERGNE